MVSTAKEALREDEGIGIVDSGFCQRVEGNREGKGDVSLHWWSLLSPGFSWIVPASGGGGWGRVAENRAGSDIRQLHEKVHLFLKRGCMGRSSICDRAWGPHWKTTFATFCFEHLIYHSFLPLLWPFFFL